MWPGGRSLGPPAGGGSPSHRLPPAVHAGELGADEGGLEEPRPEEVEERGAAGAPWGRLGQLLLGEGAWTEVNYRLNLLSTRSHQNWPRITNNFKGILNS